MRYELVSVLVSCLTATSTALAAARSETSSPAVLAATIQRRHVHNPVSRDRLRLRKRQNSRSLQETLDNQGTLYYANASLGTPAQNLRLHLDTGSSDLWANTPSSTFCQDPQNQCSDAGVYDPSRSSTYQFVNNRFNISYVDGSGATGDYVRDTFRFGGRELQNMQFGVGLDSSASEGILGIGYTVNEVQVNRLRESPYPNLPQLLVDTGVINKNSYSLWLNDLDASTGSILFGGVDTEKYSGQLQTLPIIPRQDGLHAEFLLAVTGIGINGQQGSLFSGEAFAVLMDSGSSLIYLPNSIVSSLYRQVSAQYDESQEAAIVDCDLADQDATIDFTFSGPTIRVPMNELVIEAGQTRSGRPICILGINPSGSSSAVLGDTFLRSAYVVYDLADNTISIAQTNFNATTSNILEITNGTAIPDSVMVPNAVTNVANARGGARNNGPPSVTSRSGAMATPPPAPMAKWGAAAAFMGGAVIVAL